MKPFHGMTACQDAFNKLKTASLSTPVLTHWIPDTPMTVETDASDYAIAAILSITLPDGEIHPVAFHSHTLSSSELNYDTHDKELLGVIILMVPELRWMWSPTIRIWNISLQPSY